MSKAGGQFKKSGGDRGREREGDGDRDRVDKDGFRSALPRPDFGKLKRDISSHKKEIDAYNKEMQDIRSKQDQVRNERQGGQKEFDDARRLNGSLFGKKKQLQSEKNTIMASREALHKKIMAQQDKERATKAAIKFSSIGAIEKQISELETRQKRTTMSLTDEKNLVKEIKNLNLSKREFSALEELKAATDRERAAKAVIDKSFNEKNAQLREINQKIDTQKAILDALDKARSASGSALPEYKRRYDELTQLKNTEYAAIKELEKEIKEKERTHAIAVAEEKVTFMEQQEVLKKQREAEELAREPYEEEMYCCDFLMTYLQAKSACEKDSSTTEATTTQTADGFSGMKQLKKDEDDFMSLGVAKKGNKKKGGQNKKGLMTHTHESLEQFSDVGVEPPATLAAIPACLEQLQAKKDYFKTLERGAIPTLKAKRASKSTSSSTSSKSKKSTKTSVFNMESTTEYPGL